MNITLNGELQLIANIRTLAQLLTEYNFANKMGIAVAVNNMVVPKRKWNTHLLSENDQVLIISATKGG